MDPLTQSAQSLGSPEVVVMTRDDYDALEALVKRASTEDLLTEEERLRLSLVRTSAWTCDGARKVTV